MPMIKKTLSEMTVDELVDIISKVVGVDSRVLDDYPEDILALSSLNYIRSIEKSRKAYKQDKYVRLDDIKMNYNVVITKIALKDFINSNIA